MYDFTVGSFPEPEAGRGELVTMVYYGIHYTLLVLLPLPILVLPSAASAASTTCAERRTNQVVDDCVHRHYIEAQTVRIR